MPISARVPKRVRGARGERGASALEFAIIMPLFFMLVFGMFTGGIMYDRQQSVNHSVREGARYGATVPLTEYKTLAGTTDGVTWATNVWNVTVQRAVGTLDDTTTRTGCVAVVFRNPVEPYPSGGTPYYYATATYTPPAGTPANVCFDDGGADGSTRVQVAASVPGELNAIFFSMTVTLSGRGISKHETTA